MEASREKGVDLLVLAMVSADLAPTYERVVQDLGWTLDADRLAVMKAANEKALAELNDRIKDAEENLGDVEVRDAWAAKAEYLCKIGMVYILSDCLRLLAMLLINI